MMKPDDPRDLTVALLSRSTCAVRVAAVIVDNHSIHSWGWNSSGASGLGEHAEAAAIRRANRARLSGSTIYVASVRGKNSKTILSKPCADCQHLIDKWNLQVIYRNAEGIWVYE